MLRPAPMMRLNAVFLERDQRSVLKDLSLFGAVQLTRTQSGPDTAPLAPRDYGEVLERCNRIRARVEELRRSLDISAVPEESGSKEMTLDEADESLRFMEEQAAGLLNRRQLLMERQKELTSLCERVSPYKGFGIPLDDPDRFRFLHFVTGSLPDENFEGLVRDVGENVALLPAVITKGRRSLVALTTRQGRIALEEALVKAGFQHEVLPPTHDATIDMISQEREREREEATAELDSLNDKLQTFALDFAGPLDEIERAALFEYRLLEEIQKFSRTDTSVMLSGWVPAHDAAALETRVNETTAGRYAIETALPQKSTEEEIPVLLRHSRLLRPFEMLVSMYGPPNYWELEPTLFVAISYVFMFGMMFGDAGHGAVLATCGLIALIVGRSDKARDFGLLLLFGGSSSMIFGIIYGSYFGIELFKKYALWHDPLEGNPIQLMYGAIGFGIVIMSIGLILNVINRFRRGDVIGGFLDRFGLTGIVFYWGALAILTQGAFVQSHGLMPLAIVFFLVLPIVGWAAKEPIEHLLKTHDGAREDPHGGIVSAAMESCVGAFEAVLTYLANTISFVRLAAYAMSHAALLVAAFVLAREFRDLPVGGLWSIAVIIFGNLIAIVLEGIIASVQALRLEYYEFFGKFFSGSGQPFEPFRLTAEDRVLVRHRAGPPGSAGNTQSS